MSKTDYRQSQPIFIHSLFRSGSTYLFNVFRRSGEGYWCYQEPEHELLVLLDENAELLLETHQDSSKSLRHPEMEKPYFWEFYTIRDSLRGLFDRSFSYGDFFCPLPPGLPESQVRYIGSLISNADGRPVLQCCRSSGRVRAIKQAFSGIHIHLWREPRSQWWSYKINDYFDAATQLIYDAHQLPAVLQEVRRICGVKSYYNYDIKAQIELAGRNFLSVEKNYFLFYSLWLYSYLEIERQSDVSIDLIRLARDKRYRGDALERLEKMGIDGMDLSDCSIPAISFSGEEDLVFSGVEKDVKKLFLSHGYDEGEIRKAEAVAASTREYESCAIVNSDQGAVRARQVTMRFMDHSAQLRTDIDAAEKQIAELESRLREVNNNLAAMENSISWRITEPLRRYNPKRVIKSALFRIMSWVDNRSAMSYSLRPYLKRYPFVWNKLKRARQLSVSLSYAENEKQQFIPIEFDDLELYFAKGPLEDLRGIGRVSRELLKHLQALSANGCLGVRGSQRDRVYFYSSIHWCPDILPSCSVVMIHDVIPLLFPDMFPSVAKEWSTKYSVIARQAKQIVTISKSSANDIARLLNVPRHRIEVIPNGISRLPVAQDFSLELPAAPYLVYVGSHDHHKNIEVVLSALRYPDVSDISLVMIGDNGNCEKAVLEMGLRSRVHFMGWLSDEEAGYVVHKALALVFPSLYEGFGLPPLEAALIGTPTISSSRPAMTELLEKAAIFASPTDPAEWVVAMCRLRDNPDLRDRIAAAAKESAYVFTWEVSARKLLAAIMGLREFGDTSVLQGSVEGSLF